MPPKLIQSSAAARAEHSGESIESVLAGWAGVDLDELKEQAAASPAEAEQAETPQTTSAPEEPATPADETPAPAAAPVAVAAAAAMTLDELLDRVAEVKGMPASLTKRSAEARAKKTGERLESVLLDWAGLDADTVVAASGAAPAAEAPAAAEPADAPEEPGPDPTEVEVIEGEAPEAQPDDDGVDGPPAATTSRYPVWLAAAFVLIPILAVMYILVAPDGPDCGTGGQLLVDPSTGNAVNCDGSAYGSSTVDNFAAGAAVYTQCVACHSTDGSGGVGPAFTGGAVLATFPADSCTDHIDWVALGTGGWPDSTYGANAKPVGGGGVMPPFGTTLDEMSLAQVVLYERVQFGGQDLAEAELDCGLVAEGEASAG
jgi:mono/diheme cytochrome c family protein